VKKPPRPAKAKKPTPPARPPGLAWVRPAVKAPAGKPPAKVSAHTRQLRHKAAVKAAHTRARNAKRAKKHGLAGPGSGGWWILGGNDTADNCAAVAVANSLLLSSGLRVSDAELLRLHDRAGPLSIPEAIAALAVPGFPVCSPWPADQRSDGGGFGEFATRAIRGVVPAPGDLTGRLPLVIGVATPHGPHAALLLGDGLVTWGGLIPWPDDWLLDEAWAVTW
jgi:hypothetical protein